MRRQAVWSASLILVLASAVMAGEGGWYLMLPPVEEGKSVFDGPKVDRNVPMSQWLQEEAFDSAEECRAHREIQRDSYNTEADIAWKHTPYMETGDKDYRGYWGRLYLGRIAQAYRYANALCIASNDPRLVPPR